MTFMTHQGMRVVENIAVPKQMPKFSLKPGNYVSEKFRKEFDAWLLEMFGGAPAVLIGQVEGEKVAFIHPENRRFFDQIPSFPGGEL